MASTGSLYEFEIKAEHVRPKEELFAPSVAVGKPLIIVGDHIPVANVSLEGFCIEAHESLEGVFGQRPPRSRSLDTRPFRTKISTLCTFTTEQNARAPDGV